MVSAGLARLARASSWLLLEKVVRVASAFVTAVWVARYLGPDAFGDLAFVLSFARIFSELAVLGLNALLVREFVADEGRSGEVAGTALTLRAASGAVAGAGAVVAMHLLRPDQPELTLMVALLALSFVFRAGEVLEQYFFAIERTRPPSLARMTAYAVYAAATLILVALQASLPWFAAVKAAEFVTMNAGFAAAFALRGTRLAWSVSFGRARRLLGTSWPLILSGFGAMLNLRVDQVMLAQLSTAAETGLYAAAAQISEALFFVPVAIMTAAFPALVRLRTQDPEAYRRRFQQAFDAMLWLGVASATVVAVAAPLVIPFLFGVAYEGAVPMLVLHVWGAVFIFARAPLSKWIVAEQVTSVSLMTHGIGAAVNIAANLVLIPEAGGRGAAIATVVSYAVSSYLALFLWRRTWSVAMMITAALSAPVRYARRIWRRM